MFRSLETINLSLDIKILISGLEFESRCIKKIVRIAWDLSLDMYIYIFRIRVSV